MRDVVFDVQRPASLRRPGASLGYRAQLRLPFRQDQKDKGSR